MRLSALKIQRDCEAQNHRDNHRPKFAVTHAIHIAAVYLFALCVPLQLSGQNWSTFLDSTRAIDWSTAGFSIPAYATACATPVTLNTGSGNAAGNTASIQAALNSCDATHNVVNLPAGTYYVAGINFGTQGKQVLRGAGANSTHLIATSFPSGNCAGFGSAVCMLAPNWTYGGSGNVQPPSGSNQCTWTAGYSQGTTSLTLSSCGGTPPVNQTLILDQANDTTDTNGVYMCDGSTSNCTAEGTRNQGGRVIGGAAYSQQQLTKITGVTSLGGGSYTVTISPGVYFTNIRSGKTPGAWWPGFVQNDGLENLSLDSTAITGASGLVMFSCYQCWAKGVTFNNNDRSAVLMYQTGQSVIRDSYFYGARSHASTSYNIEISNSSQNLVENNIMQQPTTTMIFSYSAAGNVIGYNFSVRNLFADGTWTWGIAASHGTGNNFNLFEGNDAYWIDGDNQSGPGTQVTGFRNLLSGYEVGMPNASTPAILSALDRDWNFVGNVLGTPGRHTVYQGYATSTTTFSGAGTLYQSIYNLGAGGTGGDCTLNPPQSTNCDPLTVSTLMRWGNYDVVTGAVKWDSTEASPAANTYVNANFSSSYFGSLAHTLPSSLYYSSAPSWWPSGKTWPPIGPNTTTGNVGLCSGGTYAGWQATSSSQCTGGSLTAGWGGRAVSLPAMDCYLNTMGGPPDGTGAVLNFNATACYVASPPVVSTPSFTPSTLGTPGFITIATSTPGAACFYTVDGSTPTTTSTPVVNHLYIAASQTVKAICSASGFTNSAVGSQAYAPTVTPAFYISANASNDVPTPFPAINRIGPGAWWQNLLLHPATDCNTYNWTALDNYIATATANGGTFNMYTFEEIPQCANGTTNAGNPPTDIAAGNTFFANFNDKFWEHICGVASVPTSPLPASSCKNFKYIETWNESNVGRYWTGTDAQMATMWTTVLTEGRKFCSDCVFIGGSTSAGGKGNEYYYTASLGILQNLGNQKPDVLSFHPYPSRDNVQNVPFPDTITSNNDPTCSGTPNVSCDVSVAAEVTYFRQHVMQDVSVLPWAGKLGVVTTEGGYGINDGVCDAGDGDWNHANVQKLRGGYASVWALALEDQGTLFNLAYVDKDQNWMTFTGNGAPITHPGGITPCTQPAFSGKTAVNTAYNQTVAWLNSGTVTGAKVCSTVTGGQVCTIPMTIGGNSAQIAYYTGWLTSHTQSTAFTSQQTLQGVTSGTGGSVTLTQEPLLLTSATSAASTPTATPGAGSYGPAQTVTLATTSVGAIICWNNTGSPATNGTTGCPAGSTLYAGPLTVSSSQTLYFVAGGTGYSDSPIGSAAYVINGTVATPTLSPVAGSYTGTQSVTISDSTSGASIFYTTDGSTPTTSSTPYTGAISVPVTMTVKALATKTGFTDSGIGSATYTITASSVHVTLSGTQTLSGQNQFP